VHQNSDPAHYPFIQKQTLMMYRTLLSRLLIIGFLGLVGYSLARSIYYKSALGVVLALISIIATVYCIQLLAKARQETESETEEIP
jgi:hypothetical protein